MSVINSSIAILGLMIIIDFLLILKSGFRLPRSFGKFDIFFLVTSFVVSFLSFTPGITPPIRLLGSMILVFFLAILFLNHNLLRYFLGCGALVGLFALHLYFDWAGSNDICQVGIKRARYIAIRKMVENKAQNIEEALRRLSKEDNRKYKKGPLISSEIWKRYGPQIRDQMEFGGFEDLTKPAFSPEKMWHTPFTQIYKVRKKKTTFFFTGGSLNESGKIKVLYD